MNSPGGEASVSKDWSDWTGEGWPTGFMLRRPDGTTTQLDETYFGEFWNVIPDL